MVVLETPWLVSVIGKAVLTCCLFLIVLGKQLFQGDELWPVPPQDIGVERIFLHEILMIGLGRYEIPIRFDGRDNAVFPKTRLL